MDSDNYSIAGIWSSGYHNGVDGNPHHYLLLKGYKSIIITNEYYNLQGKLENRLYSYKEITQHSKSKNLIKKIYNKVKQPIYWKSYNAWCQNILRKNNIELVHAHFGYTAVRILPTIKKTKLPMVVTFYGVDGSQLVKERKWIRAYQEMFQYANKCIVLCQEVKERLITIGCPEEKILIWQIPIELNHYPYASRQFSGMTRFVIGARFVEKKGYDYLLKAFSKLIEAKVNTRLIIVGYGDSGYIKKQIEQLNLNEHVTLIDTSGSTGFPEFFNQILKQNDVFVLPSIAALDGDDEGGPSLTLVAAQAAGLPVICTHFPGSEITVFEGENGIYCESKNVDSLYEKMLLMSKNPEWWNRMGKSGSEYVHKLFLKEKQFPILEDLYKSILAHK